MSRFLLRHRVDVVREQKTDDGGGGYTTAPSTVKTVRARITANDGSERFQAMQLEYPVTHEILVRKGHGILPTDQLVRGTETYVIRGIRPQGAPHRYDQILAQTGVVD